MAMTACLTSMPAGLNRMQTASVVDMSYDIHTDLGLLTTVLYRLYA